MEPTPVYFEDEDANDLGVFWGLPIPTTGTEVWLPGGEYKVTEVCLDLRHGSSYIVRVK